jgi:hypothetical protein
MNNFNEGDFVSWSYSPKGGYGYVFKTPATIISVGPKRIKIEVVKRDGTKVFRFVKESSLSKVRSPTDNA